MKKQKISIKFRVVFKGFAPSIGDKILGNHNQVRHSKRLAYKLPVIRCNTTQGQKNFFSWAPKIWNQLPRAAYYAKNKKDFFSFIE